MILFGGGGSSVKVLDHFDNFAHRCEFRGRGGEGEVVLQLSHPLVHVL